MENPLSEYSINLCINSLDNSRVFSTRCGNASLNFEIRISLGPFQEWIQTQYPNRNVASYQVTDLDHDVGKLCFGVNTKDV